MEYVANEKGQTVLVAPVSANAPVAQPAPVSVAASSAAAVTAPGAVVAAPSGPVAVTVVGLTKLEEVADFYQKEIARVEADAAVIKRFATSVITSGKADIQTDVSLFKSHKVALIILTVITLVTGGVVGALVKSLL